MSVDVPIIVPVICIAIGVFLMLRAATIVAAGVTGWFRFDPAVTLTAGFGLIVLGRTLLDY